MKSAFRSKTLWFNVIVIAYALATAHLDALAPLQLEDRYLVFIGAVANFVNRFFTSTGVQV